MPRCKSALHFRAKLYARIGHPQWLADAIQHELFVVGACAPGQQIPEQAHAEIGIFVSAPRVPRQFITGEKLKHVLYATIRERILLVRWRQIFRHWWQPGAMASQMR